MILNFSTQALKLTVNNTEEAGTIMLNQLTESLQPSELDSLARTFSRLGRLGFWIQIVVGSIPLLLMIYLSVFARSPSGPRARLALVEC